MLFRTSNGEIIESGFYKDDEKHGEWKLFDTKKRLQQRFYSSIIDLPNYTHRNKMSK